MSNTLEEEYPYREPAQKPHRGAFVVVEGLDRAGKTTQVKKLCDRLYSEGHNVQMIRFPGNLRFHLALPIPCFSHIMNDSILILGIRQDNSNGEND